MRAMKKMKGKKRIPLEITADPFYFKENLRHLEKVILAYEADKTKVVRHDLIEEKRT